ncbi:hypothetical protein EWB00_005928 [Schistosoma japonicum]|uniref:Egg protein CP422 n=1 Tax=Schistosoma japonicum TaxID=6182 RepID=C1LDX1_SCHJA|nr:hypothetical protein KSF78_0001367 [Schistosoma japonicum]TNN09832.1 hypothetical protein EWB00_005928 [Schistosoma japonicum]CAX72899.1 hypothetical protein [Schistosoma japonicum]
MKAMLIITIVLISSCTVTFGAESLHNCNKRLETSMIYCFDTSLRNTVTYKTFPDLKSMRTSCMQKPNCKSKAKSCLLHELGSSTFRGCPLARTFINSIDRLFR